MNEKVDGCLVTGHETLIPNLTLPDTNDRHVLAAAIHCKAQIIVTFNLKDFPQSELAPHGVTAQHLDDFAADLFDLAAKAVCAAAKQHRESMKRPAKTVEEYLELLERQRLPATVAKLRANAELL